MDDDRKIPASWAMPDELAKKVSERLNKKPLSPEEEIANALQDLARDIALIEPDPQDWAEWVIILLEQLESQAEKRKMTANYEQASKIIGSKIRDRIKVGKW